MTLSTQTETSVIRWTSIETPSSRVVPVRSTLTSWDAIVHVPEEKGLFCEECGVLLPATQLDSYLKGSHRPVPIYKRRDIYTCFYRLLVI